MAKTKQPQILLWDIETLPMVVTTWTLWEPRMDHVNILKESSICSVAWKWLGDEEVQAVAVSPKRPSNDKAVIKKIHKVLSQADVIVHHNGDQFDLRKFNARVIFHGMEPLPPIPTIDTKKIAKRVFGFNSNRLDYLGKFLCGTGKIPTSYDLWLDVMNGDAEALANMVTYNKMDVSVLEKVYERLRPYMRNHPNVGLYNDTRACPNCGSEEFVKQGFKFQKTTKRQQYKCRSCGGWFCGAFVARAEFTT